jgi:hypothetical protein
MKCTIFQILSAWLFWGVLSAAAYGNPGTLPAATNRLFYLQRSKDANAVIYQANFLTGQRLSPQKPVDVYWIRYAEQGQREELSALQWQMAYGYQHQVSATNPDAYEIRLNAYPKRPLQIVSQQGKPVALMRINGQQACLQKIFVQLASSFRLVPKVAYIELYGVDTNTGQPVYERIAP